MFFPGATCPRESECAAITEFVRDVVTRGDGDPCRAATRPRGNRTSTPNGADQPVRKAVVSGRLLLGSPKQLRGARTRATHTRFEVVATKRAGRAQPAGHPLVLRDEFRPARLATTAHWRDHGGYASRRKISGADGAARHLHGLHQRRPQDPGGARLSPPPAQYPFKRTTPPPARPCRAKGRQNRVGSE